MRLIDADKLQEIVDKRQTDYSRDSNGGAQRMAACYLEVERLINNQPTAYDADKVVRLIKLHIEDWKAFSRKDIAGEHINALTWVLDLIERSY